MAALLFWHQSSLTAIALEQAPLWDYRGTANPDHWGQLTPDFLTCETGTQQSPIDLPITTTPSPVRFTVNYQAVPLSLTNTGHTIQINYLPGSFLQMEETDDSPQFDRYELIQFHFHTPSEHHRHGHQSALELHLVHRNSQGYFVVLAVFLTQGKPNSTLAKIWPYFPPIGDSLTLDSIIINAEKLLPKNHNFYRYSGSLTTPPCHEPVQWLVMEQSIQLSAQQIDQFRQFYPENARPLQPLNQRRVEFQVDPVQKNYGGDLDSTIF